MKQRKTFLITTLCFGYAFLYIPMVFLILYSFNKSKHVTIWEGFSLKWYTSLFSNQGLLSAAWVSFKVAFMSATCSVIIGTLAAIVLTRFIKFKGRAFFQGLIFAPLIMPEVIMGFAFLLCFISLENLIGFPNGRGVFTITLAHATIAIAYVTAIVRTQLVNFDQSLIEAALDLGAHPFKIFFQIKLPIIFPSLMAAWVLAFILSFDDVVVASFVAGPEATTLPMLIFSNIRYGLTPEVNALATLVICTVAICASVGAWWRLRR